MGTTSMDAADQDWNLLLSNIYYNPGGVAAFSNAETLFREARKANPKITKKAVRNFLSHSYVHLRHKPIQTRKLKSRNTLPYVTSNINQVYDCDLGFFPGASRYVGGLVCTDNFSSKIMFEPITNKRARTVANAFTKMLKSQNRGKMPATVRTDKGSEFKEQFAQLMREKQIRHIFVESNEKANYAERSIQTLRRKFEQLKTYYGKTDWSRFYKQALDTINFTPHSRTKISPFAMETNPSLAGEIFMKKFGHFVKDSQKHIPPSQKQIKFPVGAWVRFSTLKGTFAKGSTATFSGETFKVSKVRATHPTTYVLEDVSGEPIIGFFYEFELTKAEKGFEKHKRISKVYKRVKEGDRRRVQVGFKGHPQQEQYRRWIDERELAEYRVPFGGS